MTCYHPIRSYYYTIPGRSKGIVKFHPADNLADYFDRELMLPCGKCVGCRMDRSQQWAVRCYHEASLHNSNCFLTLTYSPSHLPSDGSLDLRDFQLFMKRLRFRFGEGIRFFHCGEYGSKYGRPHYHALIFGFDFPDKVFHCEKKGYRYYISQALSELWPWGFCLISDLTFQSAAYTARYITKKIFPTTSSMRLFMRYFRRARAKGMSFQDFLEWIVDMDHPQFGAEFFAHVFTNSYFKRYFPVDESGTRNFLAPEYTTMSRRPGIGKAWFDKHKSDIFPCDFVIIDGKKRKVPKYYDGLCEISSPDMFSTVKALRQTALEKHLDDCTPDRLLVRKEVLLARMASLKRSFDEVN